MAELINSAKEWTAGYGDPFKEGALGGPLVSQAQRYKVVGYVESAKADGAKVVYGGETPPGKGWFYMPTSKYIPMCREEATCWGRLRIAAGPRKPC
jgi:acyl-CoA reductase-like NAD-dependent aldehyde dehydrogenase